MMPYEPSEVASDSSNDGYLRRGGSRSSLFPKFLSSDFLTRNRTTLGFDTPYEKISHDEKCTTLKHLHPRDRMRRSSTLSVASAKVEYQSWDNVLLADNVTGKVGLRKQTQPIGRLMSTTKMLHSWEFVYSLNDEDRFSLVELTNSRRTEKIRIKLNGIMVYEGQLVPGWPGLRLRLDTGECVDRKDDLYTCLIRYDWLNEDFIAEYNEDAKMFLSASNISNSHVEPKISSPREIDDIKWNLSPQSWRRRFFGRMRRCIYLRNSTAFF